MGKLYIVCNSYNPNTASANRLLSFVQGFSELGVEAEVVFLVPNSDMSKVDNNYPHVTFKYMWRKLPFSNRIINKLAEDYYGWKFAKSLKPGDVVFLTNFGNIFFKVINRKGVKVVHEKTEHPDVYSFKGFNVNRYKREVKKVDGMFVISSALNPTCSF